MSISTCRMTSIMTKPHQHIQSVFLHTANFNLLAVSHYTGIRKQASKWTKGRTNNGNNGMLQGQDIFVSILYNCQLPSGSCWKQILLLSTGFISFLLCLWWFHYQILRCNISNTRRNPLIRGRIQLHVTRTRWWKMASQRIRIHARKTFVHQCIQRACSSLRTRP